MSELDRLRELLDEQGVEHQPTDLGIEFRLAGTWCFANESDDGSGLFAGYGFMPWMCCHMRDAEHALRWCRDALGLEQVLTHKAEEVDDGTD